MIGKIIIGLGIAVGGAFALMGFAGLFVAGLVLFGARP